jgi:transcriptional regulator of acetoin/glycerol metabolism
MEHAFVLCHGGTITLGHLPADIRAARQLRALPRMKSKTTSSEEAQNIREALKKTGWNKSRAARLLGIGRRTIYRKIEHYRISEE